MNIFASKSTLPSILLSSAILLNGCGGGEPSSSEPDMSWDTLSPDHSNPTKPDLHVDPSNPIFVRSFPLFSTTRPATKTVLDLRSLLPKNHITKLQETGIIIADEESIPLTHDITQITADVSGLYTNLDPSHVVYDGNIVTFSNGIILKAQDREGSPATFHYFGSDAEEKYGEPVYNKNTGLGVDSDTPKDSKKMDWADRVRAIFPDVAYSSGSSPDNSSQNHGVLNLEIYEIPKISDVNEENLNTPFKVYINFTNDQGQNFQVSHEITLSQEDRSFFNINFADLVSNQTGVSIDDVTYISKIYLVDSLNNAVSWWENNFDNSDWPSVFKINFSKPTALPEEVLDPGLYTPPTAKAHTAVKIVVSDIGPNNWRDKLVADIILKDAAGNTFPMQQELILPEKTQDGLATFTINVKDLVLESVNTSIDNLLTISSVSLANAEGSATSWLLAGITSTTTEIRSDPALIDNPIHTFLKAAWTQTSLDTFVHQRLTDHTETPENFDPHTMCIPTASTAAVVPLLNKVMQNHYMSQDEQNTLELLSKGLSPLQKLSFLLHLDNYQNPYGKAFVDSLKEERSDNSCISTEMLMPRLLGVHFHRSSYPDVDLVDGDDFAVADLIKFLDLKNLDLTNSSELTSNIQKLRTTQTGTAMGSTQRHEVKHNKQYSVPDFERNRTAGSIHSIKPLFIVQEGGARVVEVTHAKSAHEHGNSGAWTYITNKKKSLSKPLENFQNAIALHGNALPHEPGALASIFRSTLEGFYRAQELYDPNAQTQHPTYQALEFYLDGYTSPYTYENQISPKHLADIVGIMETPHGSVKYLQKSVLPTWDYQKFPFHIP